MANDEKAKLYQRIIHFASEQLLLARMKLHGFWPQHLPLPPDPPDEAKERLRIEDEIAQLRKQHAVAVDPEKALAAERKRRWEASKQRRAENKAKREAERNKRRATWEAFRKQAIVHLGEGVSAGLWGAQSDEAELARRGLPVMHHGADVATLLGIPLPTLRWLTYHRRAAAVVHYSRFEIPKKTGGRRGISAPKKTLARAQQRVLEQILAKLPVAPEAHGFVHGRSIVSNGEAHTGRGFVVNLDLKDFFPSVTFRRVKGLFAKMGYSEPVATVLALLCTEPPRAATEWQGKVFHVALGARVLPQGACTSPAITNLICRRLDRRLAGLARKRGLRYTRYADDLTFSGDDPRAVGPLLRTVRMILADEGFAENEAKTRVMRRSRRQEVTGVTVNDGVRLSRRQRRRLRAILHNAAKKDLASQNREDHPDFAAHLRGKVAFACMVEPARAPALREALARALARR